MEVCAYVFIHSFISPFLQYLIKIYLHLEIKVPKFLCTDYLYSVTGAAHISKQCA